MCECNATKIFHANTSTVRVPLDVGDIIMSFETYTIVAKTVQCTIIPLLFLLGAPTNVLSMIIFYRQGLRDRMNLCLFCLAFTDLMFCVVLLIMVSYCFVSILSPDDQQFWKTFFIKHTLNFVYGFAYSSGCLTMIIAVERCVCVMIPMKAMALISTKAMTIIIWATMLLVQSLCGVYIVKERLSPVRDEASGEYFMILTDLYLSNSFFRIVEDIVLSFVCFLNFTVVFLATVATLIKLRVALSWRKATASGDSYLKGQAVLMRMLVGVSSLYVLCTAPNIALSLARFTVPEFRADGIYSNLFFATHMIGIVVVMLNSSINFFVYLTMSSRFRHELKTFFLCIITPASSQSTLSPPPSTRSKKV